MQNKKYKEKSSYSRGLSSNSASASPISNIFTFGAIWISDEDEAWIGIASVTGPDDSVSIDGKAPVKRNITPIIPK